MQRYKRKERGRKDAAKRGAREEGRKENTRVSRSTEVLSGRVFGIFPPYPSSLHGHCLRSLECAEGACIVRRPSYMHHPPNPPLGANPPSRPPYTCTLCSTRSPSSWPSSSSNSCSVYTLIRLRTPSYIRLRWERQASEAGRETLEGQGEKKCADSRGRRGLPSVLRG